MSRDMQYVRVEGCDVPTPIRTTGVAYGDLASALSLYQHITVSRFLSEVAASLSEYIPLDSPDLYSKMKKLLYGFSGKVEIELDAVPDPLRGTTITVTKHDIRPGGTLGCLRELQAEIEDRKKLARVKARQEANAARLRKMEDALIRNGWSGPRARSVAWEQIQRIIRTEG